QADRHAVSARPGAQSLLRQLAEAHRVRDRTPHPERRDGRHHVRDEAAVWWLPGAAVASLPFPREVVGSPAQSGGPPVRLREERPRAQEARHPRQGVHGPSPIAARPAWRGGGRSRHRQAQLAASDQKRRSTRALKPPVFPVEQLRSPHPATTAMAPAPIAAQPTREAAPMPRSNMRLALGGLAAVAVGIVGGWALLTLRPVLVPAPAETPSGW